PVLDDEHWPMRLAHPGAISRNPRAIQPMVRPRSPRPLRPVGDLDLPSSGKAGLLPKGLASPKDGCGFHPTAESDSPGLYGSHAGYVLRLRACSAFALHQLAVLRARFARRTLSWSRAAYEPIPPDLQRIHHRVPMPQAVARPSPHDSKMPWQFHACPWKAG